MLKLDKIETAGLFSIREKNTSHQEQPRPERLNLPEPVQGRGPLGALPYTLLLRMWMCLTKQGFSG